MWIAIRSGRSIRRPQVLAILFVTIVPLFANSIVSPPAVAAPAAPSDFDGDGFGDLAISVHTENLDGTSNPGAVSVMYGSGNGLAAAGDQFWHQDVQGVAGDGAETSDIFGRALATGDFNADGFADLAVGAPGETLDAATGAGAVNVLYGTASGLTSAGDQFWHQGTEGIDIVAETGDSFGLALAAGDLDGDGFADLAIGVPGDNLGATNNTGAVHVLYGSPTGLAIDGHQFWTQDNSGIADSSEEDDRFGNSLAIGKFGMSSHGDLAVGVTEEDLEGAPTIVDAGAVNVLYGSGGGLSDTGNQFWHQDSTGIANAAAEDDRFALILSSANFGKSPQADLVIGVEGEQINGFDNAGGVNVLYGSSGGLTNAGDQFWSQDSTGVLDEAEAADGFGRQIVAANFGKTAQADLAIGAGAEDVGDPEPVNAGSVNVLYGSSTGLSAAKDQFWSQDSPGIADAAEDFDFFSDGVGGSNFGKSSQADLAIGASGEGLSTQDGAGVVHIVYGTSSGLASPGDQLWHQDKAGIEDASETEDFYGATLAPRP